MTNTLTIKNAKTNVRSELEKLVKSQRIIIVHPSEHVLAKVMQQLEKTK